MMAGKPGRPATGQTPVRTVRVGARWDEAKALAEASGESMAAVIDACLLRYIRLKQRKQRQAASADEQ